MAQGKGVDNRMDDTNDGLAHLTSMRRREDRRERMIFDAGREAVIYGRTINQ